MGRRIVSARDQVEMLLPWLTAAPRRRFNQDWQVIGGDYMPLDAISHYMQRKETGFGDEKSEGGNSYWKVPLSQQVTERGYEKPVELITDGKSGTIYDGHHRIDTARQLGHSHVPVQVTWRNSSGYPDGAYDNKVEPWLKGWLTDMRGGRETVGRRTAAQQQRPERPGEAPMDWSEAKGYWDRPQGLGDDFDPFGDLDPHEEGRYSSTRVPGPRPGP